jgi:hypothetical protein
MQQNPWMQPNAQMPQQMQPFTTAAPNCGVESQRLTMERDRLQMENEQLKAQVQNQQFVIDSQNAQMKTNVTNPQLPNSTTPNSPGSTTSFLAPSGNTPWWSSGIVWAVGGAALTIGGGIVVAGVFALFSGGSQRNGRTIQVVQPPSDTTYPLVPMRRAEYLPPRVETRRVEQYDYDQEYDR